MVDSTIATMLCLGVVHPHSSGIGGGVSLVLYDRYGEEGRGFQ